MSDGLDDGMAVEGTDDAVALGDAADIGSPAPGDAAEGGAPVPAAPADAGTASAPPLADAEWPAFSTLVNGQPYVIDGLRLDERNGVLKSAAPEALQKLRNLVSSGRKWETDGIRAIQRARELERQVQLREQAQAAEVAQAAAFLEQMQQVMTLPAEQRVAALQYMADRWETIQAQAEAKAYKARLEAAQRPPEPEPFEYDPDAVMYEASEALAPTLVAQLDTEPWVSPEAREYIVNQFRDPDVLRRVIMVSQVDLPEAGVRAGQPVLHPERVQQMYEMLARPWRAALEAKQKHEQAAAVAADNAKRLAKATPAPSKPAGGSSPRRSTDQAPAMTRAQLLEWAVNQA